VRLSELPDELARREESASEVLKVIGIELQAGTLGLSGSVLLLALQLYFLVNLVVFGTRLTPSDRVWQFPWIMLYKTPLSYAIGLTTLVVIPVLLGSCLLLRIGLASCASGDLVCGVGNYACAAAILVTSVFTFLQIHRNFRPAKYLQLHFARRIVRYGRPWTLLPAHQVHGAHGSLRHRSVYQCELHPHLAEEFHPH
jgi:hypothetical protein